MNALVILREDQNAVYLWNLLRKWKEAAQSGHPWSVKISETKRTAAQNDLIHPVIRLWAQNVPHPVNGVMGMLDEESWKRILMASFKGETQRVTADLTGRIFYLDSLHTSDLSDKECTDFIEYLFSGLTERGVIIKRIDRAQPEGRCK